MVWQLQAVDPDRQRGIVTDGDQVAIADLDAQTVVTLPVLKHAPLGHGTWVAYTPADHDRFVPLLARSSLTSSGGFGAPAEVVFDFDESKHPRNAKGEFDDGEGSSPKTDWAQDGRAAAAMTTWLAQEKSGDAPWQNPQGILDGRYAPALRVEDLGRGSEGTQLAGHAYAKDGIVLNANTIRNSDSMLGLKLLITHEMGHNAASPGAVPAEAREILAPFLGDGSTGRHWSDDLRTNPFGGHQQIGEMYADAYSQLLMTRGDVRGDDDRTPLFQIDSEDAPRGEAKLSAYGEATKWVIDQVQARAAQGGYPTGAYRQQVSDPDKGSDYWPYRVVEGPPPVKTAAHQTASAAQVFDFDESKHQRVPAGSPEGGEFVGGNEREISPEQARRNTQEVEHGLLEDTPFESTVQMARSLDYGAVEAAKQAAKAEVVDGRAADLRRMLDERPELRAEFDRQMSYPTTNRGVDVNVTYPSTVGRDLQVQDAMGRILAAREAGDPTAIAVVNEKPMLDNRDAVLDWASEHGGLTPQEDLWAQDTAQHYVDHWADTAADQSPQALAMQEATRDELGARSGQFDSYVAELESMPGMSGPDVVNEYEQESMRAFVRAEYDATQRWLSDRGLQPDDTIEVYRGMQPPREGSLWSTPVGFPLTPDYDVEMPVDLNPASSWSVDRATADLRYFSGPDGYILTDHVRVRDILSTPRTGRGALHEGEIVIRNRPGQIITVHRNDPESRDPAAGMMP